MSDYGLTILYTACACNTVSPRLVIIPTNLCHHFDNKVAGHGTLAKNDLSGGYELKIAWNGGFLPPPPLMTPTVQVA